MKRLALALGMMALATWSTSWAGDWKTTCYKVSGDGANDWEYHNGAWVDDSDGRFKAVTFAGDRVIPAEAVSATLRGADLEIWQPEYPFTHENPFPLLAGESSQAVDSTFDRLFESAARFLSR